MTKEQIAEMQKIIKKMYPDLNRGGCGLFAYAFVSRVGGVGLRLGSDVYEEGGSGNIDKNSASIHFMVEYDGMALDGHSFGSIKGDKVLSSGGPIPIANRMGKSALALAVLEGSWNNKFYREQYENGLGENKGDAIWTFLGNFESVLDKLGVEYSSRI